MVSQLVQMTPEDMMDIVDAVLLLSLACNKPELKADGFVTDVQILTLIKVKFGMLWKSQSESNFVTGRVASQICKCHRPRFGCLTIRTLFVDS